ncbi:cobalamin biosynthesis protein [Kitasatospora herbaricolor]|uniref:Cobalamin biosynthesis protein n=1 Tax=Kitasatospora herbaricolor TaxID=68217 RepID=A0ABZ1W681_9ACTN|nr:cobalamin biosynthesis protein [Kitasatospora herbaricolor]
MIGLVAVSPAGRPLAAEPHTPHAPHAAPQAGPHAPAHPAAPAHPPAPGSTDRAPGADDSGPTLPPRALVIGVGAGRAAGEQEVSRLVLAALAETGLSRHAVAQISTLESRTEHPAIRRAALVLGVPVVGHSAEELAAVRVPHPSRTAELAVGTPSVAEAAALLDAPGGELVVPKRKSAAATVAVARRTAHGRAAAEAPAPGVPAPGSRAPG